MAQLKYKDSEGNMHPVRALVTTKVPHMTNPAAVTDVSLGKEYIDEQGQKQTGTARNTYLLNHATNLSYVFNGATLTESLINVHLAKCESIGAFMQRASVPAGTIVNIVVDEYTMRSGISTTESSYTFAYVQNLKEIHVRGIDTSQWTRFMYTFMNCENLETIDWELDFSSVTSQPYFYQIFGGCTNLRELKIKENTMSLGQQNVFNSCPSLSDNSLVIIGNALKNGAAKTVMLHATSKARCAQILGTVTQKTSGDVTYDFFTADESGTTTLAQFITLTKGWTLA